MAYVELHARSAFSFLRAGSSPESLVKRAAERGLGALALCDRDGVYGAVRAYMTARESGLRSLVGCELTMEDESVVPVLVETQAGYRALSSLLTRMHLRSAKGEGRILWDELPELSAGVVALSGDEEGPVRRAWRNGGARAAAEAAERLERAFGRDRLYVEVQRRAVRGEEDEVSFLRDWAGARALPLLATGGVLYAEPEGRNVLDVFTCLRLHTSLDKAGRQLSPNAERHVRDEGAMRALFRDMPGAIDATGILAERLGFTLADLGYRFPDYPVEPGQSQDALLREVTYQGARTRYPDLTPAVRSQIDRELALIGKLGFAGYFLIVWDLCAYARGRGILSQGRGSAANSTVCYCLGITAVDPIKSELLFERFLSEGRTDWPDIDIDLPSGEAREEVIQEVYRRYGRLGAAMTANVITYRGRSTLREVGKVLGFADDALDRFSSLFHGGDYPQTLKLREQLRMAGISGDHPRLPTLIDTCQRVHGLPRHLSQHSGGMVLSAGSLSQVVPLENARMPGRSVLQWDKSDCEDMGIIKVDLLGLGMMAVLQDTLALCAQRGEPVDLALLPKDDPATFELIQRADTVGLFQIESRAQMSTLPRMKPRTFYDLAVEVAIIRPGPIQGDAVHPYLERRAGRQEVTYPDPRAEPILRRTLGVVLFQEQVLRLAMDLGGFSAAQADELRRAIGFTRSKERMERMTEKLGLALRKNGVSEEATQSLLKSLASFALYGFPESHAISFALIAYASAWLKVHRTAAFYAGLLNNQPMGFYSPASLVQDAHRHGIRTLPVCVMASGGTCLVEDNKTLRIGFNSLKGIREKAIASMLAERELRPFTSTQDFFRRTSFSAAELRHLSGAGALNALAGHRRAALWEAEVAWGHEDLFSQASDEPSSPAPLAPMTTLERLQADYRLVGLTAGSHPMALIRPSLPGTLTAAQLAHARAGQRVTVAGSVITRQRPGTAKGFCFITLEDETGHANAIVRPALFEERRLVINLEPALMITGRLQNEEGVIHIMAETLSALPSTQLPAEASHDFH